MNRRRFAFWLGFGIFSLGEKLRAGGLDELAAAAMRLAEPDAPDAPLDATESPVHWREAANRTWRWFEREDYIDGRWKVTGITTPINKATGEPHTGQKGYLDVSLVPDDVRFGDSLDPADIAELKSKPDVGKSNSVRRARHGRPPSKWLRSLRTEEIRIWLKTIEVPAAGVTGMTFWTHLTRDHSFDPDRIVGLTLAEQAKLHAAAHYGY